MARACPRCSMPYWRSQRVRLWVTLPDGTLHKIDEPACLTCLSPKRAQRLANTARFPVVTGLRIVKRRAS